MIRVLHIIGKLKIGGAENVALNIMKFTDNQKIQNDFVVFGDEIGEYEAEVKDFGSNIYHLSQPKNSFLGFFMSLIKIINSGNYHIIHSHTLLSSGLVSIISKFSNADLMISHSHSTNSGNMNPNLVYKFYEKLMKKIIIINSDILIACGEKAGRYLYGNRKYEIVRNGVNFEEYRFNPDERIRKRTYYDLDENSFVIGHVGRFEPVKNHEWLLKIFKDLTLQNKDVKLVLIGSGSKGEEISSYIGENNLTEKVLMLGDRLDVNELLSMIDVIVFPSLYEGVPLTLVEAQANGLPCIISDRVSREIDLFGKIDFVSLEEKTDVWIEKIDKATRYDVDYCSFVSTGYDVKNEIKKIENIYLTYKNEGEK